MNTDIRITYILVGYIYTSRIKLHNRTLHIDTLMARPGEVNP